VVKNALMAPFLLSDKVGEAKGFLNEFALEMHGIVDVIEGLFIKRLDDGTIAITQLGESIKTFVIGALHQAKEVIVILVDIIQDFTERGHDMTGMLNAFAIPLKIVLKLMRYFGDGLLESVILYKMMNGILPLNNILLAANFDALMMDNAAVVTGVEIHGTMVSVREAEMRITELQTMIELERVAVVKTSMQTDLDVLKVQTAKVASNYSVAASVRAVMFSQMGVNLVMFASIFATQKYAKNNQLLAATIGAMAGAYVGMAIGMKLVGDAATSVFDLGARFYATVAASAIIGAGFNVMMQKLMTPPEIDYSQYGTMDTGGRFLKSRSYDMGGYTQEHGLAMLQAGETVTSKTGNMLGGGITINMGDVYANDGTDFADKLADELPIALQRVSDRGGI
jgi:hypothetical protein